MKILLPIEGSSLNISYWRLLTNDHVYVSKELKMVVAKFIRQVFILEYCGKIIEGIKYEDTN